MTSSWTAMMAEDVTTRFAAHTLRTVRAGIAGVDRGGRIVSADTRAESLLGLTPAIELEHFLDDEFWGAVHLDGSPLTSQSDPIRQALLSGSASFADVIGIGHDETRWLAVTVLPLAPSPHAPAGLLSLVDVTGVVRDRRAVDEAERLGRAAFDHASMPMCTVTDDGWIVDWNVAFTTAVGRPDHEIMRTSIDKWLLGATCLLADTPPSRAGGPASLKWFNGVDVAIRCWPTGQHDAPWMIEVVPS